MGPKKAYPKTTRDYRMATKEFKEASRDLIDVLKANIATVPETSNSVYYYEFLKKTISTAKTYNKEEPSYVDYVAKTLARKSVAASKKKENKQVVTPDEKKETEKKTEKKETPPPKKKEAEKEKVVVEKKARAKCEPKKRKALDSESSEEPTKKKAKSA